LQAFLIYALIGSVYGFSFAKVGVVKKILLHDYHAADIKNFKFVDDVKLKQLQDYLYVARRNMYLCQLKAKELGEDGKVCKKTLRKKRQFDNTKKNAPDFLVRGRNI
ncbi:hypothetical protein PENTCL1PPCAC_25116, partial [Pristionchus entomophagus]